MYVLCIGLSSARVSSTTDFTSVSRVYQRKRHKRMRRNHGAMSNASSVTSITESSMSLNVIKVTLNMGKFHHPHKISCSPA